MIKLKFTIISLVIVALIFLFFLGKLWTSKDFVFSDSEKGFDWGIVNANLDPTSSGSFFRGRTQGSPYTLRIILNLKDKYKEEKVTIKNVEITSNKTKKSFLISPEPLNIKNSEFLLFTDLKLNYEDYVVSFDIEINDKINKNLELYLIKNYKEYKYNFFYELLSATLQYY